jgi:hypothetical protein
VFIPEYHLFIFFSPLGTSVTIWSIVLAPDDDDDDDEGGAAGGMRICSENRST